MSLSDLDKTTGLFGFLLNRGASLLAYVGLPTILPLYISYSVCA